MSKVILDISMSLDGLIAEPDDDPGPIEEYLFSGETEHDGTSRTSGADNRCLQGVRRRGGRADHRLADLRFDERLGRNDPMRVPCFVVTHDVPTYVPDGPTHFTYVTDGIHSAVRQAKAVAGEKDVSIMGGASIARQALEAKLLDEIQIHLAPVIMGNGIGLFDGLDPGQNASSSFASSTPRGSPTSRTRFTTGSTPGADHRVLSLRGPKGPLAELQRIPRLGADRARTRRLNSRKAHARDRCQSRNASSSGESSLGSTRSPLARESAIVAPILCEVGLAAGAGGQVRLESCKVLTRKRALEVDGDELDELLARKIRHTTRSAPAPGVTRAGRGTR